ncbi:Phosphopantetheine attachment site [Actinokineospora alba]|uniref:Phosphopantetheine attachment site n=1 Tax=Actinokineospora alba TaxID=504798 RepID=A0A1H0QYA3_9PSEU|nr:SDR family NAD(P)-dependent oxidoreductase [Actinokineospora alba]TDP70335.1 phosphopantetheine binding protein [Actinokineospora alba]SDI33883.1 Phosphopantetheine attachment site [Actinokineospora alba]SDP22273.1 Phosphopantetheine attachment site [Actinokineospora alba]
MTETDYSSAVALIGMSGRFPGADSVSELWRNLLAGVKGLREVTDDESREAGVTEGVIADPRYVRVGGPLKVLDQFDASVFGFNPREAETMEPQHRLFLECSWEALESAGYCPTDTPGQVGVFGGSGFPFYMIQNVRQVADEPGGEILLGIGNERDSLSTLVSYKLGLSGPSMTVQTFCSTSLVAVHLAVQSLLTYESDIALAGGAYIPLPQPTGYLYEQGGILSPDGEVRSFDAGAGGTVMGSGVGVVALKRMSEALEDGDVIHAVILGSSVNNDGRVRAGYTAPGVDGQASVIESAIGVAGIKPDTIGYVECHATGTVLGDSIELAAMNRVFQQTPETPCVLGSLKPSLGHLDRASGVAGLIRAALSLEHEILPGTPNYESPNSALVTAKDRFTVLTEHQPWPRGTHPRRAGVSSFGLGGTNGHVVMEQAPVREARPTRPGPHLLTFSAADERALNDLTTLLREHLVSHPDADIDDIAYTLQVSRGGFAQRRAVVCDSREDAIAALADPTRWIDGSTRRRNPKVRLVAPAEVPETWWSELHAAVATLFPVSTDTGRDGTLAALGDALTRLGVRLVPGEADEDVVVAPRYEGSAGAWLLTTVARLWQAGTAVDWPALHGGAGRRVELPTYPFQRRRYWVKADLTQAPAPADTGRTFDRAQWTHLPTWKQRPLPLADLDEQLRAAGPWLVLTDDERGEVLVERLRSAGAEVAAVRPGAAFDQDDIGDFTVPVDDPGHLTDLISSQLVTPRTIVHGWSLASPVDAGDPIAHFDAEQDRGFYSVMTLARELTDDSGVAPPIDLVLLTSGAVAVVGTDLRHPEHATLAAVGPSLSQENPRLRCRHVDVDVDLAVDAVLAAAVCPHEGPVAVRANEVWQRRYEHLPIEAPTGQDVAIRDGDTVLITGGLGDIGLRLARHLASRYGCQLVLTVRSPLPAREQWESFLAAVPEGGERTARHITNILDLERRGATVLAMSADVADLEAMRAVVTAATERFGGIDVVVHGAGVQDDRYFNFAHLMDRDACDPHMAAKVRGFHVLQTVLDGQCPDRRITLSSLAAVLGGMTLAPYAAANAALDAYTRVARTSGAGKWITVDWDTWNTDAERLDTHGPTVKDFAMVPEEAVDVFERALSAGDRVGHLVISTGSLDARIAQWVIGDVSAESDATDADGRERHPRPDLPTPFVAPREGTEATVAEIWSAVLGIEPVGLDDNFFELGGHSLVAIKLTTRIRKSLQTSIPVTALLECPTVRQLAALIEEGTQG